MSASNKTREEIAGDLFEEMAGERERLTVLLLETAKELIKVRAKAKKAHRAWMEAAHEEKLASPGPAGRVPTIVNGREVNAETLP